METIHVHPEDGKTTRKGQIDFTEGRSPCTSSLRMGRPKESVRSNGGMESIHVHPEDGKTTRKGQIDFTEGWRATTYRLRMGRRQERVRSTSRGGREQRRTG